MLPQQGPQPLISLRAIIHRTLATSSTPPAPCLDGSQHSSLASSSPRMCALDARRPSPNLFEPFQPVSFGFSKVRSMASSRKFGRISSQHTKILRASSRYNFPLRPFLVSIFFTTLAYAKSSHLSAPGRSTPAYSSLAQVRIRRCISPGRTCLGSLRVACGGSWARIA